MINEWIECKNYAKTQVIPKTGFNTEQNDKWLDYYRLLFMYNVWKTWGTTKRTLKPCKTTVIMCHLIATSDSLTLVFFIENQQKKIKQV